LIDSVVDVAGRSDWQSPLYTALAPLALLRRGSRRFAIVLWGYAVYLFATWWLFTHRIDRFWLPMLPVLAVLAGLGGDWIQNRVWSFLLGLMMALAIVTNLAFDTTALVGCFNGWTADFEELRRTVPTTINAPLARLDAELPADAKVLLVGQASVFYLDHPIVFNVVFNDEKIETLTHNRTPREIREEFARLGLTHIYVDWVEIERHRQPGGYGYTPYVTPELFQRLIAERVLEPPSALGSRQELYRIRSELGAGPR
jgi:hypothetical protein